MEIQLTQPIINKINSFSNKRRNSYLEKGSPYKKHSKSESVNTNFAQSFEIPDWGIKDYIRELQENGKKPSSISRCIASIRSFYQFVLKRKKNYGKYINLFNKKAPIFLR